MNNAQYNQGFEIDIFQLLGALLRKWYLLLIATLLMSGVCGIYAIKTIAPTYQASVLMYVNNSSYSSAVDSIAAKLDSSAMNSVSGYIQTYLVILRSRLTMEEVIKRAEVSYSPTQLAGMISGSSVDGTAIFRITVTSKNPEEACRIANTVSAVLPEKIGNIINGASCRVVDSAIVPTNSSGPDYRRYFLIGAAVGFCAVAGMIVLFQIFNDEITEYNWLLTTFGDDIPLLSVVPNSSAKSAKKYGKYGRYYTMYGNYRGGSSQNQTEQTLNQTENADAIGDSKK